MFGHDATEIAYRNGFEAEELAALEKLKCGIEKLIASDSSNILVTTDDTFAPVSILRTLVYSKED